jgi:hypothetical protein
MFKLLINAIFIQGRMQAELKGGEQRCSGVSTAEASGDGSSQAGSGPRSLLSACGRHDLDHVPQ